MDHIEFANEVDVWIVNNLQPLSHDVALQDKTWRTEEDLLNEDAVEGDAPNGASERLDSLTRQRMDIFIDEVRKGVGKGFKGLRRGLFAPTRMRRFIDLGLLDDRTFFGIFNFDVHNKDNCYFASKTVKSCTQKLGVGKRRIAREKIYIQFATLRQWYKFWPTPDCSITPAAGKLRSRDINVIVCGWSTFCGKFTEGTHPNEFNLLQSHSMKPLTIDTTFKVIAESKAAHAAGEEGVDILLMILDQRVVEGVDMWLLLWPRKVGTSGSAVYSLGNNVKVSGRCGWIPRAKVKLLMAPTVSYTVAYDKQTYESILQRATCRFAPVEILKAHAKVMMYG
eukprot:m.5916 g.5916  ORF g.5916 m.5916 type:complete len:337 (+) comp3439_c0_seq1:352-1362(+)